MSCKYYYRGGLCANSQMDKPFCVGEGKCAFANGTMSGPSEAPKVTAKKELEFTVHAAPDKPDDSMSQWMGVYCPHYQRFFCTGGEDGCKTGGCATAETYEQCLAEHLEKCK